jgi:hypothetical protein
MNTSALFTAAHTAAKKIVDAAMTYRQKFAAALRAAYAQAKQPAKEIVEVLVGSFAHVSATYKQLDYLLDLGNVLNWCDLPRNQFLKRVSQSAASEAISAVLAGKQVRFVLI